jgi:hypothetical protein
VVLGFGLGSRVLGKGSTPFTRALTPARRLAPREDPTRACMDNTIRKFGNIMLNFSLLLVTYKNFNSPFACPPPTPTFVYF